jgi:hypothetical protein
MREKYKMADSLCDLFYTHFTSKVIFSGSVHVENENSGKYMRLRANLWVSMYKRALGG